MKQLRPLMTPEDVLANLGPNGSRSTLHGWIATGKLPSRKIGRHRYVTRAALAEFLGVPADALVTAEP